MTTRQVQLTWDDELGWVRHTEAGTEIWELRPPEPTPQMKLAEMLTHRLGDVEQIVGLTRWGLDHIVQRAKQVEPA